MVLGVCDLGEGLGSKSLECQAEELCPRGDGEPEKAVSLGRTGPVLGIGKTPWDHVENRLEEKHWELRGQGEGWMIVQVEEDEPWAGAGARAVRMDRRG